MAISWLVAALLVVGLPSVTAEALAQETPDKDVTTEEPGHAKDSESADGAKKVPRGVHETRPESLLKKDEPVGGGVDLRGAFEKRRDLELVKHYTRVAELDAIENIARTTKNSGLADRVELVRRKELRRFTAVMRLLREIAMDRALEGVP